MIGNLNRYFGDVKQICFKDTSGIVHYNGERVALNNTTPNGYIYLNGPVEFETENACIGQQTTTKPLVFVGAYPDGITENVFNAAISALGFSNIEIETATVDKSAIAEAEGVDLSKFLNVAMVRVTFNIEQLEIYDSNCDFDLCKC